MVGQVRSEMRYVVARGLVPDVPPDLERERTILLERIRTAEQGAVALVRRDPSLRGLFRDLHRLHADLDPFFSIYAGPGSASLPQVAHGYVVGSMRRLSSVLIEVISTSGPR